MTPGAPGSGAGTLAGEMRARRGQALFFALTALGVLLIVLGQWLLGAALIIVTVWMTLGSARARVLKQSRSGGETVAKKAERRPPD
jgi:hypothetical protein